MMEVKVTLTRKGPEAWLIKNQICEDCLHADLEEDGLYCTVLNQWLWDGTEARECEYFWK